MKDVPQDAAELSNPSYNLNNWMTDLDESINDRLLGQVTFASAHNAGMDKKASYSANSITCQDDSFAYQMEHGIRVFDIRLKYFHAYTDVLDLYFTHNQESNRKFRELWTAVDAFQRAHPREIVIFDFHSIVNNNNSYPFDYSKLYRFFMNVKSRLLPASAALLSLKEIRQQYPGPRIVVALSLDKVEENDRPYFWNQIKHEWAGSGQVSVDRLREHITAVMSGSPESLGFFKDNLWSMSATAFSIAPRDIIGELVNWYAPHGAWAQNSNIVNFDWVARGNAHMIRQCIDSNLFKRGVNRLSVERPSEGDTYINGISSMKGTKRGDQTTVQIGIDGRWHSLMPYNDDTRWEAMPTLPKGDVVMSFASLRGTGFSSASTFPITIKVEDFAIPRILTPTNNSTVSTSTPTVSGDNGVPGATVRFFEAGVGGHIFGTALVKSDKTWSGEFTTSLPFGSFPLTCDQTLNDVQSGYSDAINFFIVDIIPKILTPIHNSTVRTSTPTVSGDNGVPGATVRFFEAGVGAHIFGTAQVLPDKTWSGVFTNQLPLGSFPLTCDQTLNDVRSGYSDAINFIVDIIPKILTPTHNSTVRTSTPTVSGDNGVPGATVRFFEAGVGAHIFGTARVLPDRTWSGVFTIPLSDKKKFPLTCDQVFNNGQSSYEETVEFTDRLQKPEPPWSLSISSGGSSSAQFSWRSPPDDPDAGYIYFLSGQPEQTTFERHVSISNLTPDTSYTFNVLAVVGDNLRSSTISADFRTGGGVNYPWNFHTTKNERRSISFAWEPPKHEADAVIGYSFKVFPIGSEIPVTGLVYTTHNMIVGLPIIFGVKCRFKDGSESSWNQITVIPKA